MIYRLQFLQERLSTSIESSKERYYYARIANRLSNTQKSTKTYCSLLKIFLNNKKIPLIPPLFHENRFIIDFKEKAEFFNSFFSNQCYLLKNCSKLPTNPRYVTDERLRTINFTADNIEKIIVSLNSNKAHGHDNISIRMLKICGDTICKPLELIFKQALTTGVFPSEWKKGNIVPCYKKGDKQNLKNYRPVSLLPICGKIFERLIFNEMFSFFLDNNLLAPNQSGFKPGDSCINQLLSITHEIYSSFDDGFEVRSVFLDISKAFDKVWHEGVIFKLKQNGISDDLLNILSDFLRNRKQRVTLNGQSSSWTNVNPGVPQGSILGPLLFLIYINDLSDGLSSNAKLFADDTSLFLVVHDINTSAIELNKDLKKINDWAFQWEMTFNPDRSKQAQEIIFSRKIKKATHPSLLFNNNNVSQVNSLKHLGVILDVKLTFEEHLKNVFNKTNKTIRLLRKFCNLLPRQALVTIYKAFVRPYLDYGDVLYDQAFNNSFHAKIESIQYNACLAITGAIRGTSKEKVYLELGLESLQLCRWYRKLCLFYKVFKNEHPKYLFNLIPVRSTPYATRTVGNIPLIKTNHNFFKNSFFPSAIIEWNNLDPNVRNSKSISVFKAKILNFIRPSPKSFFDCHNPKGIKLITRLRLGLSHLREHKFKHSFQDTINPLCNCGQNIESSTHFFLHCPFFINERRTLLSTIRSLDS